MTISAASDETYAIKSLNNLFTRFPKANHHPLFSNFAGTFSRQGNSKKEFVLWGTKGIIQVTRLEEGRQHRQGWLGYRKRKYNYWEDGSQIAIGSMSRLDIQCVPQTSTLSRNTTSPPKTSSQPDGSTTQSTSSPPHFYPHPIPNPTTKSTCVDILSTGIGVWEYVAKVAV